MAEIKLIATDLDGTFLKGGHTPHPENIKAVRACQEAGIRVCACTGRNWAECRKIVEEVGFDDFCAVNNGAAIVEVKTGELRYRNRFDPEAIAGLVDVMLSYPDVKFGLTGLESTGVLRDHMEDWFESEPKELLDELYHLTEYDTKEELVEACKEDVEASTAVCRSWSILNRCVMPCAIIRIWKLCSLRTDIWKSALRTAQKRRR